MGARQGSESVALKDGSQDHLARTHEVSPLVEGSPLARMQPVADDLARYTHIYHIYITRMQPVADDLACLCVRVHATQ